MAKDKKMVEAITSMDEDFAQWYTDVVKKAELCDYSSVKGCMVIKPAGYALWENIQHELDRRFKETGVRECIHADVHSGEPAAEGEGPRGGLCSGGCLGYPRRNGSSCRSGMCVRPTSETLFCDFYAQ